MQGRDDVAGFVAGFAGDDRYIVDYLVEEVLQRQSDDVRDFLLRTCMLTRLTGPLCDAVTGQPGSRATLDALERRNLFLVPLDDRRRWYRYHHLFADVLRMRLLDEEPERVAELHSRASEWFERNGERSEAIDHALAGGDVERAADLVELSVPELRRNRQEATLRSYMRALPADLFGSRPVLSVGYVGVRMTNGELDGVDALLRGAERWVDPTAADGRRSADTSAAMRVVDDEEFRRLPGTIAMYRAGQARLLGDLDGTMAHARRVLELVDEGDFFRRGAAASLLGLASWTTGDLEAAHRWYAQGMADLERAGFTADVVGGAVTLADLRIAQGRLGDAMRVYERGLQRAEATTPPLRGAADMHVGMADLLREHDDLDGARRHLRISQELGEHAGFPQNPHRWRVAMAGIRQLEGDPAGALELLAEAERLYDPDFSPEARPIPAVRARVWIALGEWRRALGWARERGLAVDDELSYLREFEHITLARALLARLGAERDDRSIHDVTGLLERLLGVAQEGQRTGSVLEISLLQALASQACGNLPAALPALRRALTLAEPEGYVRIFLDEGPPMSSLLRAVAKEGAARDHVRRLLAAAAPEDSASVSSGLIEPLSDRELDVLRLLSTDLGGPDIARELVVSLHTVRTHTNHIYAKLGVNNRRAAVRRAEELDLLARRDRRPGRVAVPGE
jgi:LuxR family maltose regulon positive regulatory protein